MFWKALIASGTTMAATRNNNKTIQTAPETFVEGRKSLMEIFFLRAAEVLFFRTWSSFCISFISLVSFSSLTSVYFGTCTYWQGHKHEPEAVRKNVNIFTKIKIKRFFNFKVFVHLSSLYTIFS